MELISDGARLFSCDGETHVLLGKPENVDVRGLGPTMRFHQWVGEKLMVLRVFNAPVDDIELTSEMIKAGEAVLWEELGVAAPENWEPRDLAVAVFRAMITAQDR